MKEPQKLSPVEHLAGVFKGGRISGWVERNRVVVESGTGERVDMESLLTLSPGFAEKTKELPEEARLSLVQQALALADKNPLSATRL